MLWQVSLKLCESIRNLSVVSCLLPSMGSMCLFILHLWVRHSRSHEGIDSMWFQWKRTPNRLRLKLILPCSFQGTLMRRGRLIPVDKEWGNIVRIQKTSLSSFFERMNFNRGWFLEIWIFLKYKQWNKLGCFRPKHITVMVMLPFIPSVITC